jgi:hypothetical protein
MGRIIIVENKATGKIRKIDRSLPAPVKSNKPPTFNFVPIQSSVFTQPIRVDAWNSTHQYEPSRSWKYWYKHAAHQFDRPDLMKRRRFVTPPLRPLYEKGLCIYPRVNHF